jgi:hypothetical protein
LDHGVQSSAGKLSIGARKLLCGIEFVFKVDLVLCSLVVEEGAVIEAYEANRVSSGKIGDKSVDFCLRNDRYSGLDPWIIAHYIYIPL